MCPPGPEKVLGGLRIGRILFTGIGGNSVYGIYILHYPIIQLLLYAGWFEGAWGYYLVAVVLITLAGAIAMWHLVEKRFLFRNSHYIKATNESERHSNLVLDAEAPERQAG